MKDISDKNNHTVTQTISILIQVAVFVSSFIAILIAERYTAKWVSNFLWKLGVLCTHCTYYCPSIIWWSGQIHGWFYHAENNQFQYAGYSWTPSSVHSTLPPNALYAGSDADGAQIFVGRAFFQGKFREHRTMHFIRVKQKISFQWKAINFHAKLYPTKMLHTSAMMAANISWIPMKYKQ